MIDPGFQSVAGEQGEFSVRLNSARLCVSIERSSNESTWVVLTSTLLQNAHRAPELFEFLSMRMHDFRIGRLTARPIGQESVDVVLSHQLLADRLDPVELNSAIAMLLLVADRLDDELANRFGGTRAYES